MLPPDTASNERNKDIVNTLSDKTMSDKSMKNYVLDENFVQESLHLHAALRDKR